MWAVFISEGHVIQFKITSITYFVFDHFFDPLSLWYSVSFELGIRWYVVSIFIVTYGIQMLQTFTAINQRRNTSEMGKQY